MRWTRLFPVAALVAMLAACGSQASGPATPQTPTPTPPGLTEPPRHSVAPGSDAAEDNVCYAQDITVVRPKDGPMNYKRCVKAGVKITVQLTPDENFKFGDGSTSDESIATVKTTQLLSKQTQLLVATQKAGDVSIQAGDTHVSAQGPQSKTFTLTVSVS